MGKLLVFKENLTFINKDYTWYQLVLGDCKVNYVLMTLSDYL